MSTSALSTKGLAFTNLPARKWSVVAWAVVAAFSVAFSYLLTLALGLSFLGVSFLLLRSLSSGHFYVSSILLGAFSLLLAFTVLWSLIPRRDSSQPNGILIDLSRESSLHAELKSLAQSLGEQVPSDVYLVPAVNAAVTQSGGIVRSLSICPV